MIERAIYFYKISIDCKNYRKFDASFVQPGDIEKDRQMAKEASSGSLLCDPIFAPDALPINMRCVDQ